MNKRLAMWLVVFLCGLLGGAMSGQEKITLSTPVFTEAGATDFRVWSLYLKRAHPDSPAEIRAIYREVSGSTFVANGRSLTCLYADSAGVTTAETLIVALNKANLSVTSLEKRVLQRCQQDGKLGAGTISGVPQ